MTKPILTSEAFLNKITEVVPSKIQKDIQSMGYYNFIHFGLNTFTGKEWGSGKVELSNFKIDNIDTDLWANQLKSTGSKGIILTAKHHDGFCLFPSKYTDYTIKNTRYRNGKGDLVKELSDSCKKYGLKFGIYLSPWDRHEKTYGTDEYNDFFCNQLTELCTNYGEIFCFWFDGACGEGKNGKKQIYDWQRYYKIIRTLQPTAAISNCGPDVRWIGNENGRSRESEFSVVPTELMNHEVISAASQQKEGAFVMSKPVSQRDQCLGSREKLLNKEICWYPAEMNIPITYFGWFYHRSFEILFTRSVKNLKKCYYNSVGNNAMLLINVPPDKKGHLPKKFIGRMIKAKREIESEFKTELCFNTEKSPFSVIAQFDEPTTVSKAIIKEDISFSQRVESFEIYADNKQVFSGKTIGFKKICFFKPVKCSKITLKITLCRKEPVIKSLRFFE